MASSSSSSKSKDEPIRPKMGHVKEVCKKWLIREDGALAQKLQTEEIKEYYSGNKERNAIVREDFPKALDEQRKEEQTAKEIENQYRQWMKTQEDNDRLLAEQVENYLKIEKLRNEEIESNRAKELARRLHKMEKDVEADRIRRMQAEAAEAEELARLLHLQEQNEKMTQAERDRLLAIQAQNEELAEKDRLIAIQAQDEELAKMLQEREKKRAKRIKEKYRLKKQQQQAAQQEATNQSLSSNNSYNEPNYSSSSNYDLNDTYANPIDCLPSPNHYNSIDTPDSIRNFNISNSDTNNKQFHKSRTSNVINHHEDDDNALYALPIDVQSNEYNKNIPDPLRELKPKQYSKQASNSLNDSLTRANFIPLNLQQPNFPNMNGNFDGNKVNTTPSPITTPSSTLSSFDNSIEYNNNNIGKKKKDKKDKCTHQ